MSPLQPNSSSVAAPVQEFSREERAQLLRLAHDSISSALEHREIPLDPPTPHLAEPRGAFTSLHLRGELRGCVGYVLPTCPVYRAVAETARAAAFDDNRFPPVSKEEAPHLEIELSILSPAQPIRPEEIEVGRHGLLIGGHGHRGLLLPQVPVERGWDRITFLEQTCRKAGLPMDAWQKGATIEAFTAEVFGEKSGQ
ncbi:MAG TPA: AmmeMemoRadiSam system protein A [Candidatus Acidoferrum sp.]|nr:AmmeMemoRadiSam system protein A [Candidatus Acidoferrum sp.]